MNELDAAVQLLGPGARWGSLAATLILAWVIPLPSFIVGLLLTVPRLRGRTLDAYALARESYPMRRFAAFGWLFGVIVVGAVASGLGGPLGVLPRGALVLVGGLMAALPTGLLRRAIEARVMPAENASKGLLLRLRWRMVWAPHVVLALLSWLLPWAYLGAVPWWAAVVGIVPLVAATLGATLWLGRALRVLRAPSGRLAACVSAVQATEGLADVRVLEARAPVPNGWVLYGAKTVLLSETAVALLDDAALEAMLTQLMARLKVGPAQRALTAALSVAGLGLWVVLAPQFLTNPRAALLCFVWGALCFVVQRALMLRGARLGDAAALRRGPEALGAMLLTLYAQLRIPVVLRPKRLASVNLYDRLEAMGVPLTFARPEPPRRAGMRVALALTLLWHLATAGAVVWLAAPQGGDDALRTARVMLTAGTGRTLGDLGYLRYREGRVEDAIVLYRAASAVERETPWHLANLTIVFGNQGRCEDARRAFAGATARRARNPREARLMNEARRAMVECAMGQNPSPRSGYAL